MTKFFIQDTNGCKHLFKTLNGLKKILEDNEIAELKNINEVDFEFGEKSEELQKGIEPEMPDPKNINKKSQEDYSNPLRKGGKPQ